MIFTRNPELGKCKTRLAKTIGDQAALDIYTFLLNHTAQITQSLPVTKQVYYSVKKRENDLWDTAFFDKKVQNGDDLGARMYNAFYQAFQDGYEDVIIIGSDMYDLKTQDLQNAFNALKNNTVVLGPAEDGGYYLLGMKKLIPQLFKNKNWGTKTVLKDSLKDLKNEQVKLLETRNDIDYYEDIKEIEVLQQFLPNELKQ